MCWVDVLSTLKAKHGEGGVDVDYLAAAALVERVDGEANLGDESLLRNALDVEARTTHHAGEFTRGKPLLGEVGFGAGADGDFFVQRLAPPAV